MLQPRLAAEPYRTLGISSVARERHGSSCWVRFPNGRPLEKFQDKIVAPDWNAGLANGMDSPAIQRCIHPTVRFPKSRPGEVSGNAVDADRIEPCFFCM
jgi:hypothetical protein